MTFPGGGKRATCMTITTAIVIWILAIICGIPALAGSNIKHIVVNSRVSFEVCYLFPQQWGPEYAKGMVLFRFLIYYAVPLILIGIFYIMIAIHLVFTSRVPGEIQGAMRQVFIDRIPSALYEDNLIPLFETIGVVAQFRLMMNYSGRNRGFGYIIYADANDAHRAIVHLNNIQVSSRCRLQVSISKNARQLWLGNVSSELDVAQVIDLILEKVDPEEIFVRERNGRQCFLKFSTHREAAISRILLFREILEWKLGPTGTECSWNNILERISLLKAEIDFVYDNIEFLLRAQMESSVPPITPNEYNYPSSDESQGFNVYEDITYQSHHSDDDEEIEFSIISSKESVQNKIFFVQLAHKRKPDDECCLDFFPSTKRTKIMDVVNIVQKVDTSKSLVIFPSTNFSKFNTSINPFPIESYILKTKKNQQETSYLPEIITNIDICEEDQDLDNSLNKILPTKTAIGRPKITINTTISSDTLTIKHDAKICVISGVNLNTASQKFPSFIAPSLTMLRQAKSLSQYFVQSFTKFIKSCLFKIRTNSLRGMVKQKFSRTYFFQLFERFRMIRLLIFFQEVNRVLVISKF